MALGSTPLMASLTNRTCGYREMSNKSGPRNGSMPAIQNGTQTKVASG